MYILASSGASGSPMSIPVVPKKKMSFPSLAKFYSSSILRMCRSPFNLGW